jgi:hypothetical protein
MYGVIDFSRIDTEPGAASAFAPPSGFDGDYREYMRERWKNDPGVRQHIAVVGWMLARKGTVTFCGPFSTEARRIAEAVRS